MSDILLTRRISRKHGLNDIVHDVDLETNGYWLAHVLAGNAVVLGEETEIVESPAVEPEDENGWARDLDFVASDEEE